MLLIKPKLIAIVKNHVIITINKYSRPDDESGLFIYVTFYNLTKLYKYNLLEIGGEHMPKEIWNQGRVVGYSAYESYVRQALSENPDLEPASEREWLASSIASGSSLVIKIKPSEETIRYIPLPENSRLCAANTIFGSFFLGSGVSTDTSKDYEFITRVSSYGPLFLNENSHVVHDPYPSGYMGRDDKYSDIPMSKTHRNMMKEYTKILDGIVIQPGNWVDSGYDDPYKDLHPDMSKAPVIKIMLLEKVTSEFYIILTGFTIRSVISGVCGTDGSIPATSIEDGSFLGPSQFPWATKITFSVPSSLYAYYGRKSYDRSIPSSDERKTVTGLQVIDMKKTDPGIYYLSNYSSSRVKIEVYEFHSEDDSASALTVYSKKSKYPPALFGTLSKFNESTGDYAGCYLNPLDIVAPGSIKMFNNWSESDMQEYEQTYPGTIAMKKDQNGLIYVLDDSGNIVPASDISVESISYTNLSSGDKKAKLLKIKSGSKTGVSLSLSDDVSSGTAYTIGNDGKNNTIIGNTSFDIGSLSKLTPASSNFTISSMLEALANNKSVDILGTKMKALKAGLEKETSAGNQGYIQLPNGLRLYISATKPTATDIPVGSIGIGWTEE